ncbi:MAG: SDR family NAD(P)-dependent oxidoreductase, partial [Gemmatimonadota bacterium]
MDLGLRGKVVLVTGGSRGIGAAIARGLGSHGASVIINYHRNQEKADEVLAEVRKGGGDGLAIQADVRDAEAVQAMVEAAITRFGGVDVLVNNANINFAVKPFVALSWEEISDKLNGEMKALYNCSQAVLRDMTKRGAGKLIFISSGL